MNLMWSILHFLPFLGFLLALVLLVHLAREQRSPSGTIAWLLAIVLVPYVGVPLYLMLGGRKLRRMARQKARLPAEARRPRENEGGKDQPAPAVPDGVFAPREGNQLALLPTGEDAFRTIMHCIEAAQESICITTFILGNDSTGRAAARRVVSGEESRQQECGRLRGFGLAVRDERRLVAWAFSRIRFMPTTTSALRPARCPATTYILRESSK